MQALSWIDLLLRCFYAVIVISCIVVVLSENRKPLRQLAWIIALITLPVIGVIFYMFFGRSLKGIHLMNRRNKRKLLNERHNKLLDLDSDTLSASNKSLIKLTDTLCRSPFTVNNKAQIFTSGKNKFKSLMQDIKSAKESICLQYYIFNDDETGNMIADLLMEKSREGVSVKVLYDHVGSFSASNKFFRRMRKAGIDIKPFFRVTFPQLANRINWRNHRKIVIIDRKIGYIGGMNIANRYMNDTEGAYAWRDTHVRVEGDIVESLLYSFVIDWNFLRNDPDMPSTGKIAKHSIENNTGMQFISSGPTEQHDNLTLAFLKAIGNAKRRIYIQTPYFLPTDSLMDALEAAAVAKIDVRIMLPSHTDSKMLEYASFSYVSQCLKAGIKVYLYSPGMLHSKMMIVDDDFVTIGSTNFDFRSFENNFECNLLIYDRKINEEMRSTFFTDLKECKKLTLSKWRKRRPLHKLMESLVRLFSPIL